MRRPQNRRWLSIDPRVWLALAFALTGCGPRPVADAPPVVRLHVAAASDLQAALPELVERFRVGRPGVEVVPTFGSSGQLAEQIKAGAPFDLFLAANQTFVADLAKTGLVVPDSVAPYAIGSLVVVVPADAANPVTALAHLARADVKKVAIANPDTAPYGSAAREVLKKAGLWEGLQPRLVIAESVRQALQFAQTGNVEAALVGRAISKAPGLRVVEIDGTLYAPIVQAIGVVAASEHRAEAGAFRAFVLGESGQSVLEARGFKRAPLAGP